MPSRKRIQKAVVVVQPRKKRSKRKGSKRRGRMRLRLDEDMTRVLSYAATVKDPCNGPLSAVIGSAPPGTLTERVRTTMANLSNNSAGYIVWFPSFHNDGAQSFSVAPGGMIPANMYAFASNTSTATPTNTNTSPAGTALIDTTGLFLKDPANVLLDAATPFSRATTVSACLQMDVLAQLSTISGQVAVVSNFSLANFIRNTGTPYATAPPQFPSVDEIFAFAATRQRIHPEGAEVIWRPNAQQSVPRSNGELSAGITLSSVSVVPDAAFWAGTPGSHATTVCAANPNEIYGVCIAWKGYSTSASLLSFNAVKVVNLELSPRSNQIEPVVHSVPRSVPFTNVESITNKLDEMSPGWQNSLISKMKDMGIGSSQSGVTGVGSILGAAGIGAAASNREVRDLLSIVWSGGTPWQARSRSTLMDRV